MAARRFLTLDLGMNTGWVFATTNRWVVGCEKFKRNKWEGSGAQFLRFETWLVKKVRSVLPLDAVVYEQVAHQRGPGAFVIDAQRAILVTRLHEMGVQHLAVNVQTLKAFAVGKELRERLGIRGAAKKEHMRIALGHILGKLPAVLPKRELTDDEVDAIWLAEFTRKNLLTE